MRILIFSITYFPFVGGAEVAVREITSRLNEKKFEFDLITAKLDKNLPSFEKIGNVDVYRIGHGWILDKYFFPFLAYSKASRLHKQKNYDIVQAIMANYAGLAALFFKLKNRKIKYLLTMQSGDSDFFIWLRTWFWYPLYRMVYTKADYIQPISHWLERRARKYGYKGNVEIIANGVDLNKFKIKGSKFEIRKELGFAENDKLIITVSRLVKKNGVEDLIKAMAILKSSESNYRSLKLLILGTGELERRLKKLASNLDLKDNVIFLGHVGHETLPKYLWSSDIFCRPSLTEGFGNVFVEAMAATLPIIATPVGGIVDFLEDGKTGITCRVKNSKSIAEAIEKLLSNKELYGKIVTNGQKLVEENYGWDGITVRMENIYEKLETKI